MVSEETLKTWTMLAKQAGQAFSRLSPENKKRSSVRKLRNHVSILTANGKVFKKVITA